MNDYDEARDALTRPERLADEWADELTDRLRDRLEGEQGMICAKCKKEKVNSQWVRTDAGVVCADCAHPPVEISNFLKTRPRESEPKIETVKIDAGPLTFYDEVSAVHAEALAVASSRLRYSSLRSVLDRAYAQAAEGKGRERHGTDRPFDKQPMQAISDLVGSHHGLLFQAIKKAQESTRMDKDAAVRELLGAINYLAGAIIFLEKGNG